MAKISERTNRTYNLHLYDEYGITGKYDIPFIYPVDNVPNKLIGFNEVMSGTPSQDIGVHFFLDDYQFERVWNNPDRYVDRLSKYDCVLTPDFSLYTDMPIAMQIWNTYRSRLIGQYWQSIGMSVIPTISWSDEKSYDFCFDGLGKNGTVAVSTVGIGRNKEAISLFEKGFKTMLDKLKPINLLVYGDIKKTDNFDLKGINIKSYTNERIERVRNNVKN